MKVVIGIIIIVAGVALGIYFGLWVMFIGGIMAIAHGIDAHEVTATLIAINIVKIMLASIVGYAFILTGSSIGMAIIED